MLYLVDASYFVFRAWFSMPEDMVDSDGNPVNALYGFTRFLGDFLENSNPELVGVAFDTSLSTCFRNEIYPNYKANREPAPEELKNQFARCRDITKALGLADYAEERFEADDIIGTLVMFMRTQGVNSTILSKDKDLLQLLNTGDIMWDYAGGKRLHYKDVLSAFGVRPEQVVDYLALAGDSVDNIPGVPGIGPKTASALLAHFESMDKIYERLNEVAEVPIRGAAKLATKLSKHRDIAYLSRRLTKIACDVPMQLDLVSLKRVSPDFDTLNSLYDEANFGPTLRRQLDRIASQF
ncbi:MAG: 5'-3' exonuclease H3TH domain-containing protein [Pseudomonadota bacterium]|nr:5'-3' exonuclease H3TH domain-containing protein [Pseudomonadota bacterium]